MLSVLRYTIKILLGYIFVVQFSDELSFQLFSAVYMYGFGDEAFLSKRQ